MSYFLLLNRQLSLQTQYFPFLQLLLFFLIFFQFLLIYLIDFSLFYVVFFIYLFLFIFSFFSDSNVVFYFLTDTSISVCCSFICSSCSVNLAFSFSRLVVSSLAVSVSIAPPANTKIPAVIKNGMRNFLDNCSFFARFDR